MRLGMKKTAYDIKIFDVFLYYNNKYIFKYSKITIKYTFNNTENRKICLFNTMKSMKCILYFGL